MNSMLRWSPARQTIALAAVTIGGLLMLALLMLSRAELAPLLTLRTVTETGGVVAETRHNPLAFLVFGLLAVVTLGGTALLAKTVLPLVRRDRSASADHLATASATLRRELASALAVMRGNIENNKTYAQSLSHAQTRLAKLTEADQVRVVISLLVAENERMRLVSAEDRTKMEACAREIDTLQASLREAEEETLKDPLTGIGNRRLFNAAMREAVETSNAHRTPLSLIMCDIDHFKRVNDKFGHHVGDEIIRSLARIIEQNVRETDSVARYGGEEFAIILPGVKQQDAAATAERIRKTFGTKKYKIRQTSENLGAVTASFGVAEYRLGDDAQTFVQRADSKLYEAKVRGRDCVADFNAPG